MLFITIFLFGTLSSAFALIFELIIQVPTDSWNQSSALTPAIALSLLILALIEETSKYFFLRQYAHRYTNLITPKISNILILGFVFGIGFSLLEIFLSNEAITNITALPTLIRSILHAGTGMFLAYFILRPSSPTGLKKSIWLLASATLIHTSYNFFFLWAS